jgi:formate dehydrogenase subunit delta
VTSDGSNKLVRMANQIADNFAYGDHDKAVAGVLDHLTRFWTVEMKQAIIEHQRASGSGLNEVAAAAITQLSERYGETA